MNTNAISLRDAPRQSKTLPAFAIVALSFGLGACNSDTDSETSAVSRVESQIAAVTNWGDPNEKGIRPGNVIVTEGASCTTSFVFRSASGRYYVSTAAHCVADSGSTDTDGCVAGTRPVGTTVSQMFLNDPSAPNTLLQSETVGLPVAYSSWNAMQDLGETSAAACAGNDFALLEVPASQVADLHPASLHFRAPTGMPSLQDDLLSSGESIWGFGASEIKAGVRELHPKQGFVLAVNNEGWTYTVYLVTPGVPGDSGGHIMTNDGGALGVASTLALAPFALSNNYTNIAMAIDYAEMYLGTRLEIVTWDDFNASLVPGL